MLREVSIEIIRRCPNNCVHCSSESGKHCVEELPFEKFKEVVTDAARLGAETICLSGGEPFLHERIAEMVKFIHSKGLACFIYTSGIVFDSLGQVSSLPENTLSAISGDVTKIIFNIEAGSEDTYDKIMGTKHCFNVMQDSVRNAVGLFILTEAHFVPMKHNINEINDVIALCSSLGISKVSFLRLVPHGRAEKHLDEIMLSAEDLAFLKIKLDQLQKKNKNAIRIGVPLSTDVSCHKCEAASGKLNIRYDGKVFPCEVFKNCPMTKKLGSLLPSSIYEDSLFNIYQNSKYLQRVRELSRDFYGSSNETCVGQRLIELERSDNNG